MPHPFDPDNNPTPFENTFRDTYSMSCVWSQFRVLPVGVAQPPVGRR
jgi:hypothetical protein